MLLPLRFVAQRLQIGETRKNRLAKRLAFLYGAILFGVERGEQPLVCNGDDRRQRRIQGGAVGAAACRMRVPPKARSRRRVPQPVGSSASKSLRPCRAEHAAFASQTGLRLKSPTGAFTPSGHRRPFWFSFVRQKRTYPAPRFIFPHSVCAGWKTALQAAVCAYRCATFPFPAPDHSPICRRGCTARCARPPTGRL